MAEGKNHEHLWGLVVAWLLGLVFLFPWNSVITIGDYYYVLFPDYHPSRVFTVIYQASALITTLVFTWFEARVSTRLRVLLGYGAYLVLLLLFIIVDVATSGHGGVGPYVGVCALVGGLGIANGVTQGALQGDLSFMDPTYTQVQAYNAGIALAGVVTSGLRFVTKAAFGDSRTGIRKGALLFFALAVFVELIGFGLYAVVFPRLEVVKRYRIAAHQQGALTVKHDLAAAGVPSEHDGEIGKPPTRLNVWQLALRNWDYLVGQIVIYTVSSSIFPGFLYEDTGNHELGAWYALVLVAVFNAGDFVGSYLPLIKPFLLESRKGLFFLCLCRGLFIPSFYFAAKYADGGLMIFLCIMLGLTGGWFSVLGYMRTPGGYSSPEQNAIGNLLVLAVCIGLTLGAMSGWLWLLGQG